VPGCPLSACDAQAICSVGLINTVPSASWPITAANRTKDDGIGAGVGPSISAQVPPQLESIILKCLQKRPEQRYQSMTDLRDDLQALVEGPQRRSAPVDGPVDSELAGSIEGAVLSTDDLAPMPAPTRRWVTYVAFAAPLAIVGLGFAARLNEASEDDATAGLVDGTAATLAGPGDPVPAPAAPPPAVPPAPLPTQVLLGASPAKAHVFRDGVDLGETPVAIDVVPGTAAVVEVRHADYETRRLELDGTLGRVSVELSPLVRETAAEKRRAEQRARRAKAAARASRKRKPTKAEEKPLGGHLFVEPWQKP
jgi:serine/threonine-protein kinase